MASRNPYETLGIGPKATDAEIRNAYRKLAKKYHPDLNPGNREAESRFKDIGAAYSILGDKEKRARFDRGEIDASGAEQPQRHYGTYRHYAESTEGNRYHPSEFYQTQGMSPEDIENLFSFFGGARRGESGRAFRSRGADLRYQLNVDFLDAIHGARKRLDLPGGKSLSVRIPAGLRDGQILRLVGQGEQGKGGLPSGDALIQVHVNPHPLFRREGDNIHIALSISLNEAVLGAKVAVPTVDGQVTMTIPPNSNTGQVLRLRGKGVPKQGSKANRGDQYVTLQVALPDKADTELTAFLRDWASRHPYNPRRYES